MTEAEEVMRILNKYAQASCQIINLDKSTMVFSAGTSGTARTAIQNVLGIQVVPKFDKYLGMPAVVGRSKKAVFEFIKDRVWERIKQWNERDFSMASREVLIKAVLQAIPTYVMSCFLLPSSIVEDIEKLVRQFWWGGGKSSSLHWLSWSRLCRSKNLGGMGFQDLECFNLALLAKQSWRIVTEPDLLLARILLARYFPHGSFFTADVGERPSLTWRSRLAARSGFSSGLRKQIGNGLDTSIWGIVGFLRLRRDELSQGGLRTRYFRTRWWT